MGSTTADLPSSEPAFGLYVTVASRAEADAVAARLTNHDGIDVVVEPYEEPQSFEPAPDPAVGLEGDAAKDVAERFVRDVLQDESVTTSVTDSS